MVVPGLEESFAVAVTRLVLVGRAGLRLHEEVFLAGTRLARRQAVGEQRAEELLESALDRDRPRPVPPERSPRSSPRRGTPKTRTVSAARVERGHRRPRRTSPPGRRSAPVEAAARPTAPASIEIFDRFGVTLRDALARGREDRRRPAAGLFEDERRQSERDLREIRRRIDALDDERERELAAVDSRYDDIRAWEFPAAVIFALAPQ